MSIYKSVTLMIKKYGGDVAVRCQGEKTLSRAIIQPMLYKNKMYLGGDMPDAGWFDGGHYMMIAPADISITDYRHTVIDYMGSSFVIKRSEVVSADDTPLYIWAVLTPWSPPLEDDYRDS